MNRGHERGGEIQTMAADQLRWHAQDSLPRYPVPLCSASLEGAADRTGSIGWETGGVCGWVRSVFLPLVALPAWGGLRTWRSGAGRRLDQGRCGGRPGAGCVIKIEGERAYVLTGLPRQSVPRTRRGGTRWTSCFGVRSGHRAKERSCKSGCCRE